MGNIGQFPKGLIPWNLGKPHSQETKDKIGDQNRGRKHSESWKQHQREALLGLVRSDATRQKHRDNWTKRLGTTERQYRSGRIRRPDEPQAMLWRRRVFSRDGFTCRECGVKGGRPSISASGVKREYLEAHHIRSWKNFPESRYDVDNGITICRPCHVLANRMQWIQEVGQLKVVKEAA